MSKKNRQPQLDSEEKVIEKKSMGETEKGKKLQIVRDNWGNWDICFESGGELPKELKGKFTSSLEAERVINGYLGARLSG